MSKAPMQFLKEEYLEPLNLNQDDLCEKLNLGKRTVNELFTNKRAFTITTASKFAKLLNISAKKILMMQLDYDLSKNKVDTNDIKPIKKKDIDVEMMNYLNVDSLKELRALFKNDFANNEELVFTLFTKVPLSTTVKYMSESKVALSHLKKLYEFYIKKLNGNRNKEFEFTFLDSELEVVEKACNYEKYFEDSRSFEKYLYNRFLFFKNSYYFLVKAKSYEMITKEAQRALYLYEFLTEKEPNFNLDNMHLEPVSLFGNRKIRPYMQVDKYGLVDGLEKRRYKQFKEKGVF